MPNSILEPRDFSLLGIVLWCARDGYFLSTPSLLIRESKQKYRSWKLPNTLHSCTEGVQSCRWHFIISTILSRNIFSGDGLVRNYKLTLLCILLLCALIHEAANSPFQWGRLCFEYSIITISSIKESKFKSLSTSTIAFIVFFRLHLMRLHIILTRIIFWWQVGGWNISWSQNEFARRLP